MTAHRDDTNTIMNFIKDMKGQWPSCQPMLNTQHMYENKISKVYEIRHLQIQIYKMQMRVKVIQCFEHKFSLVNCEELFIEDTQNCLSNLFFGLTLNTLHFKVFEIIILGIFSYHLVIMFLFSCLYTKKYISNPKTAVVRKNMSDWHFFSKQFNCNIYFGCIIQGFPNLVL